jgi:hypothetical protein
MKTPRTGMVAALVLGVVAGFALRGAVRRGDDVGDLRNLVLGETQRLGDQLDQLERGQRAAGVAQQLARADRAEAPSASPSSSVAVAAAPPPGAADDETSALDESAVAAHAERGRAVIAAALTTGTWTETQRTALRDEMVSLPPDEVRKLMREVIVAANEGKLRPEEGRGPMF